MNHQLPYVLSIVLACISAYICGREAERGQDSWSLAFLLMAFVNFFVGLGGLLA